MPLPKICAALLMPLGVACTTLQPLPDARPETLRALVKPGDTVQITRTDGERLTLHVAEVTDEALHGTANGARQTVLLHAIRNVEAQRIDGSKTAWVALGVAAVVGLAVVISDDDDGGGGGGGSGY